MRDVTGQGYFCEPCDDAGFPKVPAAVEARGEYWCARCRDGQESKAVTVKVQRPPRVRRYVYDQDVLNEWRAFFAKVEKLPKGTVLPVLLDGATWHSQDWAIRRAAKRLNVGRIGIHRIAGDDRTLYVSNRKLRIGAGPQFKTGRAVSL